MLLHESCVFGCCFGLGFLFVVGEYHFESPKGIWFCFCTIIFSVFVKYYSMLHVAWLLF